MHSWHAYSPGALAQHACFSSSAGNSSSDNPSNSPSSSPSNSNSSSGSSEQVVDQLSSMMEVMMQDPAMQQLLLSRLPPHMQRPEVLRAMMANQEVRARIAWIAQQSGLDKMFAGLDPSQMAAGIAATQRSGLEPSALLERFSASPSLSQRMNNPRVLAALMDMASNGPEALKKYSGDQEVVEAAMEAGDIIQKVQQEQEQQASSGTSSSSSSSSSAAAGGAMPFPSASAVQAQLGMSPQDLMQRLMQRPELLQKFQDPKVQQALQEVSQQPWKIVKYLFNSDVMSAIKELKEMVQPPPKK
ncbi:hypothetical protein OEZ85_010635 [Tetradesmus obliquus]|uniref:STI1 domain-containing protein n=1 Tax=Tetradesmus obliquus TaxID=3088 RepID=A0ABY8TSK6_TETOB|nr:hypothetical protein OEZ85_010635 [Tetradesmus obliquus]